MLVQWLHPIPEKFFTVSQLAQEWICGILVKWRKHYVALLVLVSNVKEDQSAVVIVVHQALEAVSAVHCQERNQIKNHRNVNRDRHSRKFLSNSFFYSHQSLLQELEINHQLLRPHFRKTDDLSSWSPSGEKIRQMHRINTLVLPLLRQDDLPAIGDRNEWLLIARLMVSWWIRVMDTVLNTN